MGCKFSKVKNERRKKENQEDTVNSDANNDVLKICRKAKGKPNTYRSEKRDSCKDRRNGVSSNASAIRWVASSDPENEKRDCDYVYPRDGSKDVFPSMGYKDRERKKNERVEKGMGNERNNEQDSRFEAHRGDGNMRKGKMRRSPKGAKMRGNQISRIENNIDNNSFTGIIKTINNTIIRTESTARDGKEKGESPSPVEKKTLFKKKKIKFLYKTREGKICTKEGQNEDPYVPLNESMVAQGKRKKTKESYNCLGSKKKEEQLMRAIKKNKEQLLYYHDFKSMILRKNTFLHIYEFYKFNSNVFNLFSLMPSHLSENVHASKILFESSLIGNYIILPWIENDPDIKNNSYVKHVKLFSGKKKKIERDGAEDPRGKEVNFCGFFNNNYDHRGDGSRGSGGNGENGKEGRNRRSRLNNRNDNAGAEKKTNRSEDEHTQNGNALHDKHTSKNTSRPVLKKKLRLCNRNTEREKKYVSNRNFSMDNLFKLHLRKTSTAPAKKRRHTKEVVGMPNGGAKRGAINEKEAQGRKVATNREKPKKIEAADEGKRASLKGRERKRDQTKKQNGVTLQAENSISLGNKTMAQKDAANCATKYVRNRSINRVAMRNGQKGKDEGPIRHNAKGMENKQTDKEKRNHNNPLSAQMTSTSNNHEESIGHGEREALVRREAKRKSETKKKYNSQEEEKKKGENSTHVKRGEKGESGLHSDLHSNLQSVFPNNVTVAMNGRNIESRVDTEKEGNRKKKETDGKKCNKNAVRISMAENQMNGIDRHVGKKGAKEEGNPRSSNNDRGPHDGGHTLRREEKENYTAHGNESNTNCNEKVMRRVKRQVECHEMLYHGMPLGSRNQSSKDGRGVQMEDPKSRYKLGSDNNTKNDKVESEKRTHLISNKLGEREYLREEKMTQEICEHKYGLNESSIKKNYLICRKCHKKRCIYHYVNSFKLYGWVDYKWTDPDGYLELSVRQKKKFDCWKRLSELYSNPIVMSTDLYNSCIRQGFVADCSFLSSLTVLIEYERKHKVPVLSNIISPCTANYVHVNKTWPIFNPCGMYICRLHCNGIQRKIIIDDYVPVKSNNSLLVAYSNNQKELWVTLLEKAFVKLMGGSYSMYGSNPGSDLYYLTGWIPVTISLKSKISNFPPSLDRLTAHTAVNQVSASSLDACDGSLVWKHPPREKPKGRCVVRGATGWETHPLRRCVKKEERKNVINRKRSLYNGVGDGQNRATRCAGGQVYLRRGRTHPPYDFPVGANLSIHRLGTNRNCHPARADWSKWGKLKVYWTLRHLYATEKRKEERWHGKEKSSNTEQRPQCTVKRVSGASGTAAKETQRKRTPMEGNHPPRGPFPRSKKITRCVANRDGVKDPPKGAIPDWEVKIRHENQFLCEPVSNMDLSSYVCGSIDQYSYLNQKEERSVLMDDEYEEYDEKWDIIWNNIYDGIKRGKCVVCLGTLELKDAAPSGLDYPEGVSLSTGIVTRHAYSILNIETYKGDKLLYIKNPWGCIRWKGKYSHHDETTWTKEVQKKLNYSIEKAKGKDDGCFWIPWKDVVKYFSHIYICWNSVIFPYQFEIHTKWENSTYLNNSILQDDTHLVAYNPQFALHVNVKKQDLSEDGLRYIGKNPIEIWILLSKHVRERKGDASQKYLALHIHSGRDRIICPLFPIKQGIYSNGECTFTKLVIGGEDECINNYLVEKSSSKRKDPSDEPQGGNADNTAGGPPHSNNNDSVNVNSSGENQQEILRIVDFVLIVSQYSQKEEFNFTLKVFSHTHLSIYELPPMLPKNYASLYFKGQWTSKSAGGCSNNLWSYFRNPHIRFYVPEDSTFCIFLECSQEHSVNLRIFKGITSSPRSLKKGEIISSGAYKAGCCYIECTLESGIYCLIPSLYRANVTGDYQICIHYPKSKQKPLLHFIPYSYVVPPLPFFKYKLEHLYSLKNYSVILFHSLSVTLLSLRVTFFQHMNIKGIPFVNIYKLVGSTDSYVDDLEAGNVMKNNLFNSHISHNRYVYKIVQKCNIHGGPGYDILPLSTCAYDYYIKFNSVLIPLVQLENEHTSYLLLITTNIKEDILYNHQVHFVSEKQLSVDTCYPVQS
ncbi:hypothetical protein C922_01112 [Plasmodium inui San Antonio 1]|uniref:Calpain catalytic domain-containing protein n=1 Tax=Plasmodium inui San Antonio 1 TaxID=1237626 RepID=W7A6F5_9APIC|nr:hypothetical protein C922_01112 [Plasmodium inui San Antonio 1]EUD68712.1 hypothetical protein C922_01112 [Plasmodium inui San Antonio 1]